MMDGNPRDITMRGYLKKGVEETLIAASMSGRVRMALENVPEFVKLPMVDQQEIIDFVASKIPQEYA
jgi:hypothetical protein